MQNAKRKMTNEKHRLTFSFQFSVFSSQFAVLLMAVAVTTTCMAADPRPAPPPPDATESALVRRVYDAVLPSLFEVKVPVIEDRTTPPEERTVLDRQFDRFVRQRVPIRLAGIRVAPDGTVLVRDPNLPLRRYATVEIIYGDGTVTPARVSAVLKDHAGILLEPIDPPGRPLPHVAFEEADIKPGDPLLVAYPTFLEQILSLRVEKIHATATVIEEKGADTTLLWWEDFAHIIPLRGAPRSVAPIILDGGARVLGVALDNALWSTADGADSWIGPKIMSDTRLTPTALGDIGEEVRTRAHRAVKEVEIQFRKDSRIPQQIRTDKGKLYLYGVLVDGNGGILVPTMLGRDAVRQIEQITVREEEKLVAARFEGLYRELGAFLVRAKGVSGKPVVLFEGATLPRGKIFYTLTVRRRYGRRHDQVEYNRYLDVATGYKEAHYPLPMKPLRVGDLIADEKGRLLGFHASLRREEQDEIRARTGGDAASRSTQARVYLFSEIADLLKKPAAHFDTAARPMTRKEERAMVWIGVEYQPMNASLARALKAEGPTHGGARGLLVTQVYPSSPAGRLGVKVGHILLTIEVPGTAAEIDLVQPIRRRISRSQLVRRRSAGYRLWRSRHNYLTAVLTLLGDRRDVRLRVLRNQEVEVVPLTLETAPDDFDNADEYEQQALGLTVRHVTYEVRSVLRLSPADPGVVVSKVEPGSKAAVAQIGPYELITRVNGKPVSSPKEFERLLHETSSRQGIELLVQNLGQSRIVELDLTNGML